jgi:ubiquitin-like modifier-activating enzyme 5
MGIISGFLSQNVLKYLLRFGEVSPFLGYNAFTDFFPKYPLYPNSECTDQNCKDLQKLQLTRESRIPKKEEIEKKEEIQEVNEWGITLEDEVAPEVPV